jgi:apolipoprotein N-acyltransferase
VTIARDKIVPSALCVTSGALYFAGFLSFDLFPLAWICFLPVLFAVRNATTKQAFAAGALFGTVTNAGGFYWVIHVIVEFGQMPMAVAVLGFLLLCAYQGLLLAIALAAVRHADRRLGVAPVWSLPVALVALEWLYPLLFPSSLGNSQFHFVALTQIVEVTGMLGLTALIGLVNGGIYELIEARRAARVTRYARVAVPLSALVVCIAYGTSRLPAVDAMVAAAPTVRVAVVQTNIGGQEKETDPSAFFRAHLRMSKEALAADPTIDLLMWPESAYDRYLKQRNGVITDRVVLGLDKPVILGVLSETEGNSERPREYFNTVALVAPDGEVLGSFDKVELLAFGETLPLLDVFPALRRVSDVAWFSRGRTFRNLRLSTVSFLPTICYEDIIPSLVRRVWRSAGPADALVNVTNDSWYGDTAEPTIHLALASFRSIETRRALVRATNTGISAVVDPAGRVVQRTSQWAKDLLVFDVPLIQDGSSTVYMRVGDVLGWIATALALVGLVVSLRR